MIVALLSSLALAAQVDLLQPGEGEKSVLAMHPKVGTTEVFEVVLDLDMKMDMGQMGQIPTDLPPMVMVLEGTIQKVEANGDVHYTYALKDTEVRPGEQKVDPMMLAAVDKALGTMDGFTGTVVSGKNGEVKDQTFKPPPGADPQQLGNMQKTINNVGTVFPTEAIGTGARWRVTQPIQDNGISLEQTVVYTLKERKGDVITLTTETLQKPAADATFSVQGAQAELVQFKSMGHGETVIDLGKLFPTTAELNHYLNSAMQVTQPQGVMTVGVEMDMKMNMARK